MEDPRSTSPGSIMPRYPWLLSQKLDTNVAAGAHQRACAKSACRIPTGYENGAAQKDLQAQAEKVVANLKRARSQARADREIIAVIAYLQRLGHGHQSASASLRAPPPNGPIARNAATTSSQVKRL